MDIKKLIRKLKIGYKVLREQGLLGFFIVTLQFVQKNTSNHKQKATQEHKIYTKASWSEIVKADLTKRPPEWRGTDKKNLHFNWLMPPPGKGSGGHLNIFRFIKYLEDAGHSSTIYCYIPESTRGSISAVKAIMGDSFPQLEAEMRWFVDGEKMATADGILATSWETAYPVYNSSLPAKRFYFIQDFEPYFYPVGSLYSLAENTYRFGFYGITAGKWLSTKLSKDYKMTTDYYDFGTDNAHYSYLNPKKRKEILFYARPFTERRGFELGIMALEIFHQRHPDYTINLVGYDVSNYHIPFPYKNLKLLELGKLNELYNKCAAGLVLSFTNMSLLPLELLGSGVIPVINDGENNTLVSNNEYMAYSSSDPLSLARKISEIVSRPDLPEYAQRASESVARLDWVKAGNKFVEIVERETRNHE